MSGNQIGSVIGAAIGALLAPTTGGMSLVWASRGMSIGGMIGGMLMPDEVGIQDQNGPRLSDLKITSATYGAAINRVYGAYRIGGNIIYSSDIKETKHIREEEVGKGGSESYEVITYTYSVDMAIAFCEGEVKDVRRIWADSVLIYDKGVGGTTSAYQASEQVSGNFEIYKGSSTQSVDWFLKSVNSDSPAYRNICYIRFKDFQLEKYGNRIPNITAEIIKDGEYEHEVIEKGGYNYNNELISISGYDSSLTPPGPNLNDSKYFYLIQADQDNTADAIIGKYDDNGLVSYEFFNHGFTGNNFYTSLTTGDGILAGFGYGTLRSKFILFNTDLSVDKQWDIYGSGDSSWWHPEFAGYSDGILVVACRDISISNSSLYSYIITSDTWSDADVGPDGTKDPSTSALISGQDLQDLHSNSIFAVGNGFICVFSFEDSSPLGSVVRVWDLYTGALKGTIDCNSLGGSTAHFAQSPLGIKVIKGNILYSVYNDLNSRSHYILKIDLETLTLVSHDIVDDGSEFTSAYAFGSFYAGVFTTVKATGGFCKIREEPGVKPTPVTISSICQELMISSGVLSDEMDFLDTESLDITGFLIDSIGSARSAISVLQTAFIFDFIENDFQIITQKRGDSSIKTIDEFILDNGVSLEHRKNLLTELPRKVTFKYSNASRDYLVSSQSSLRVDTASSNNYIADLPIVLSDTEAKKLTELYLFNAWSSKDSFVFSVNFYDNRNLKVGSVVTLSSSSIDYLVRIVEIVLENYSLKCTAILESNYESSAIGQDTSIGFIESSLSLIGDTTLKVFDPPSLDNSLINSFGIYFALTSSDTSWNGASIFKSKDLGNTYSNIGAAVTKASFGKTRTSLANGPTTIIDTDGSVQVYTYNNKFENISYSNLFNGKNYIKIGDEILQYMEYTEDGNNLYTLSTLLRGRRGTEWATSNHSTNEDFILLNFEDIGYSFNTLNTSRIYKAVTFGAYLDDADEETLLYQGTNLKPFAPTNAIGLYEDDYSLVIDWYRRDRYISGYLRTLPLSETSELYNVYIYDKDSILLREELSVTQPYIYTSLMRIEDGLYGTKDDTFIFEVAQVSAQVGEGYRLNVTKQAEHSTKRYSETFSGVDNTSPAYSFYSLYNYNVNTYIQDILDNSLRLYVQAASQYGRSGIKFNNPIIDDFDISFDFSDLIQRTGSSLVFFIGSIAIYIWRDSNRSIKYYDYDSGVLRSINRTYSYGSIRVRSMNNVVEYMWKDGDSVDWEVATQKIYTLDFYGKYPYITTYEHSNINGDYDYRINNIEAIY